MRTLRHWAAEGRRRGERRSDRQAGGRAGGQAVVAPAITAAETAETDRQTASRRSRAPGLPTASAAAAQRSVAAVMCARASGGPSRCRTYDEAAGGSLHAPNPNAN